MCTLARTLCGLVLSPRCKGNNTAKHGIAVLHGATFIATKHEKPFNVHLRAFQDFGTSSTRFYAWTKNGFLSLIKNFDATYVVRTIRLKPTLTLVIAFILSLAFRLVCYQPSSRLFLKRKKPSGTRRLQVREETVVYVVAIFTLWDDLSY